MKVNFDHDGHAFVVTTEHEASSCGELVVLRDGELTYDYRAQLSDHGCGKHSLQLFGPDGLVADCYLGAERISRSKNTGDKKQGVSPDDAICQLANIGIVTGMFAYDFTRSINRPLRERAMATLALNLGRELTHVRQKIAHGCADRYCSECDKVKESYHGPY